MTKTENILICHRSCNSVQSEKRLKSLICPIGGCLLDHKNFNQALHLTFEK